MSIRTIVEFNHDYIERLCEEGHISRQLRDALCSERTFEIYEHRDLSGIRRLRQRHHSEAVTLEID